MSRASVFDGKGLQFSADEDGSDTFERLNRTDVVAFSVPADLLKGFLECRLNRLFGAFFAGEVFEFYNVREPGFSAGRFDHKVDEAERKL